MNLLDFSLGDVVFTCKHTCVYPKMQTYLSWLGHLQKLS